MTLKSAFADVKESNKAPEYMMWSTYEGEKNDVSSQGRFGSDSLMHVNKHEQTCSVFQPLDSSGFPSFYEQASSDKNLLKTQFQDREAKHDYSPGLWSLMPPNSDFSMLECNLKASAQVAEVSHQKAGMSRYDMQGGFSKHHGSVGDQYSPNWLESLLPNSQVDNRLLHRVIKPQPMILSQHEVTKPQGTRGYKLFGFNLNSSLLTSESVAPQNKSADILLPHAHPPAAFPLSLGLEVNKQLELPNTEKFIGSSLTNGIPEKLVPVCPQAFKDNQDKVQGGSTRSCTKVSFFTFWVLSLFFVIPSL